MSREIAVCRLLVVDSCAMDSTENTTYIKSWDAFSGQSSDFVHWLVVSARLRRGTTVLWIWWRQAWRSGIFAEGVIVARAKERRKRSSSPLHLRSTTSCGPLRQWKDSGRTFLAHAPHLSARITVE